MAGPSIFRETTLFGDTRKNRFPWRWRGDICMCMDSFCLYGRLSKEEFALIRQASTQMGTEG